MKTEQENFAQLVNLAMQTTNVSHMRAVIEKELLHYYILFALERGGFLDKLVFQGGTSLRLCYGGNRFSEDLDFAGGKEFNSFMLKDIKACIEKYIGERYGLEVTVKEPKELKKDPKYSELKIDKWQVAVVTAPQRKDLPKQKIKLEVANIPAYTKQPLPLNVNYDFLPDGYSDTLILAETLDEVMADKIISLPATTKYVRHRDIWDLAWLQQQGAQLDIELVKNKVADYQLEQYQSMLSHLIDRLPELITSPEFIGEMKRFLDTEVFDRTLGKEKFQLYLQNTLTELFKTVLSKMFTEATEPNFKM
ncbi:nucleotidyl transferase AbiEii/AbiGii toxin family protein [Pseudoalteromonas shioyasakiensis]|uniref:nucleotidyl transferase AbiEii/AbiGii toxin family protein n=1 Tax=Pseudoalteromonas shioyasakiensis TaxID=1190813 RepID=UPI0020954FCA|nr:nucleotidyl transferase AbiEii/AbiGii toxin family protein [Pseudoalteromonas shioyasakiensis]MCO6356228.1 nucleotidyl transferase AbiEii/AbiGii toxin family protein [Pseudoalteromonas shioyasakiensis]